MSAEQLLALTALMVSTTVTPGPNNIMVMTSSLNYGIVRTLPHYLGICLGFPLMFIILGLGLNSIMVRYPQIHTVIKTLGIAYLLYLAWKIATTRTHSLPGEKSNPLSFIQAALFQWVNPKAWVMAISTIAAFTLPDTAPSQSLLMALVVMLVALPCVGLWVGFGSVLQSILNKPETRRRFNIGMGLLLVASIIPIV